MKRTMRSCSYFLINNLPAIFIKLLLPRITGVETQELASGENGGLDDNNPSIWVT